MKRQAKAILGFDTSAKGGAALIVEGSPYPERITSCPVPFGTPRENEVLTGIFAKAKELKAQGYSVVCGAEQAQGVDRRAQSIRAGVNQRIGVLKHYATLFSIPWAGEVAPNSAKLALTGSGNAPKHMVQRFVLAIFGVRPADDNEADAFAVAMAILHGRIIVRKTGGRCHKARVEKAGPQGRLF